MKKWEIIKRETKLDLPWFKIVRETVKLANGQDFPDYYVMEISDVVMIVPVTKLGKLVLVKQYKHGSREIMIEFPAGYVQEGELAQEAAERELIEETGLIARTMTPLTSLSSVPNRCRQRIHLFVAQGLVGGSGQSLDPTEKIEVIEMSVAEMVDGVLKGEIWASDTVAALFVYIQNNLTNRKYLGFRGGAEVVDHPIQPR